MLTPLSQNTEALVCLCILRLQEALDGGVGQHGILLSGPALSTTPLLVLIHS